MRYVIAMVAAVGGLMGLAGEAKAQGFPPRCPQACPCSSCYNWTKYSGNCVYPDPRPMPPDPWANRGCGKGGHGGCGAGGAGGMGGQGMNWHRYLRSPRDFYMYGGCYPNCR